MDTCKLIINLLLNFLRNGCNFLTKKLPIINLSVWWAEILPRITAKEEDLLSLVIWSWCESRTCNGKDFPWGQSRKKKNLVVKDQKYSPSEKRKRSKETWIYFKIRLPLFFLDWIAMERRRRNILYTMI